MKVTCTQYNKSVLCLFPLLVFFSGYAFSSNDLGITSEQFFYKFNQGVSENLGISTSIGDMKSADGSDNNDKAMLITVDDSNGVGLSLVKGSSKVKEITAMYIGSYAESDSNEERAAKATIPLYIYSSIINITSSEVSMSKSTDIIIGLMTEISNSKECGVAKTFKTKKIKYTVLDACTGGKFFTASPL